MLNFQKKLILSFIFYGLVISGFSLGIVYFNSSANLKKQTQNNSFNMYEKYKKDFYSKILYNISTSLNFVNYINDVNNNNYKKLVENLFLDFAKTNLDIKQISYLSLDANEKISSNKNSYGSTSFIVKQTDLKNRKNSSYFKKINIFKNNKKVGILIVSVFTKQIPKNLYKNSFFDIFLIFFFVILTSFPLASFFSKKINELKKEADSINETLELKIKKITYDLNASNLKLIKISTIDFLTEIPNRRYFFTMGKKLFASSKRHHQNLCMLVLDIDYFKNINDTYGHQIGDYILKHISTILKTSIREEDILSRVGGEEFAIIFYDLNIKDVELIALKIKDLVQNSPYIDKEHNIKTTISIGLSQINNKDEDISCVFQRADKNLYKAKKEGKNCIKT